MNNDVILEDETNILVCDYIKWWLFQEPDNFIWEECPKIHYPNRLMLCMRFLASEFENYYDNEFQTMVAGLNISSHTAFPHFMNVCEKLFHDGHISWGRIVALYAFAGVLCQYCIHMNMIDLVGNICDWVVVYCHSRLLRWIINHGGWNSLIDFYERIEERKLQNVHWNLTLFVSKTLMLLRNIIFPQMY